MNPSRKTLPFLFNSGLISLYGLSRMKKNPPLQAAAFASRRPTWCPPARRKSTRRTPLSQSTVLRSRLAHDALYATAAGTDRKRRNRSV